MDRDACDPLSSTMASWLKCQSHPWVLTTDSPGGSPNPLPLLWMLWTQTGHPSMCSNSPTTPDTGNAKGEPAAPLPTVPHGGQGCDKSSADDDAKGHCHIHHFWNSTANLEPRPRNFPGMKAMELREMPPWQGSDLPSPEASHGGTEALVKPCKPCPGW